MGEAKRRKETGKYPKRRPSGPGRPVPHDGQWYWLEAGGHVYRLVRGARIQNMELRRAVHDAARPPIDVTDHRTHS